MSGHASTDLVVGVLTALARAPGQMPTRDIAEAAGGVDRTVARRALRQLEALDWAELRDQGLMGEWWQPGPKLLAAHAAYVGVLSAENARLGERLQWARTALDAAAPAPLVGGLADQGLVRRPMPPAAHHEGVQLVVSAVELLQDVGVPLTSGEVVEALGSHPATTALVLGALLDHRWVERARFGGRVTWKIGPGAARLSHHAHTLRTRGHVTSLELR